MISFRYGRTGSRKRYRQFGEGALYKEFPCCNSGIGPSLPVVVLKGLRPAPFITSMARPSSFGAPGTVGRPNTPFVGDGYAVPESEPTIAVGLS